jgi:hypothetical protein
MSPKGGHSYREKDVKLLRILTAVADIIGGMITITLGLFMLLLHLTISWVIFNAWLWLGAPLTLMWANEEEKQKGILYEF